MAVADALSLPLLSLLVVDQVVVVDTLKNLFLLLLLVQLKQLP